MGNAAEPAAWAYSGALGIRSPLRNSDLPCRVIRFAAKGFLREALRRDCTESRGMCLVFFFIAAGRRGRPGSIGVRQFMGLNRGSSVWTYSPGRVLLGW